MVDTCDITSGVVRQVIARGVSEVVPFDKPRGRRKLVRYLGDDERRWDERFRRRNRFGQRGVGCSAAAVSTVEQP